MSDYLALEWGNEQICGIDASTSPGHVRVKQRFTLSWPDDLDPANAPVEAGQWLKSQLRERKVSGKQVVVSLLREAAIVRHIELPDAPDEDVPDLVRFQAAARSAAPMDQLLLDYLPWPLRESADGRDVLMATIPKALAETIKAVTGAAGLELVSIGLAATATANVIVRTEDETDVVPNQTSLVVLQQGERVEFLAIKNRHLIFTHATRLIGNQETQAFLTEVSRTLVALQENGKPFRPGRTWLIGAVDEETLLDALEQRLTCAVQTVDPFAIKSVELSGEGPPEDGSQFVVPIGMLLSIAQPCLPVINFLDPRKRPVERDTKKAKLIAAAAGLFVLIAGVYGMRMFQISQLDRAIASRTQQIADMDSQLKEKRPEVEAVEVVQSWVARGVNWLDLTSNLAETMNGTERYYVTKLKLDQATGRLLGTVKGDGVAKDRHDIETLYAEIMRRKTFEVHPHEIARTSSDDEYPYRFELDAELTPDNDVNSDHSAANQNTVRVTNRGTRSNASSQSNGIRRGRLP